eukprot:11161571-Alexandrium_andersonii.AAC.1
MREASLLADELAAEGKFAPQKEAAVASGVPEANLSRWLAQRNEILKEPRDLKGFEASGIQAF